MFRLTSTSDVLVSQMVPAPPPPPPPSTRDGVDRSPNRSFKLLLNIVFCRSLRQRGGMDPPHPGGLVPDQLVITGKKQLKLTFKIRPVDVPTLRKMCSCVQATGERIINIHLVETRRRAAVRLEASVSVMCTLKYVQQFS